MKGCYKLKFYGIYYCKKQINYKIKIIPNFKSVISWYLCNFKSKDSKPNLS